MNIKRRNFLGSAALLAGGLVSPKAFAAGDNSESVKFSVFADMHFRVGNYNWTVERMAQILERARKNKVDFIIHCGDFCHDVRTAGPVLDQFNNFELPHYHTMGNHDFEGTKTLEEVVSAYQMKDGNFYSFDRGVFRFIVLDTNYFRRPDGSLMHYASSTAYEKCHQKEAILPPEQIAFLREKLSTAKGPCAIFSHHGFKHTSGITNAAEAKDAVFDSQKYPVIWINGHHHRNSLKLEKQVAFFNLNSTTSEWVGKPHHAYPEEIMKKCNVSKHELLFDTPVHAIITMSKDGEIDIDGMKGGMFMGITPEMTGNKLYDDEGLPVEAYVLSSHFKLYPPKRA